jgi:hypothetical protein
LKLALRTLSLRPMGEIRRAEKFNLKRISTIPFPFKNPRLEISKNVFIVQQRDGTNSMPFSF